MGKRSKFGWFECILGLALIALGVYTFIWPQAAISGLVVVYSVLAVMSGITDIVFYVRLKSNTGLGPATSLVTGIICVLAGFMLLLNPLLGRWLLSIVFPVWFIAHSVSRLANHRTIRAVAGKGRAGVSLALNVACVVLGVLMFFSAQLSTLSLGYLVAIALVAHGGGNVIEAFSKMGEQAPDQPARPEHT